MSGINFRREKLIIDQVKKLDPQSGEILVLRTDNPSSVDQRSISEALRKLGKNVFMLILSTDQDIERCDERTMNRYGWFRKNNVVVPMSVEENSSKEFANQVGFEIEEYLKNLTQEIDNNN